MGHYTNRDFKGVWIPKEIWLNSELSIQEKCLLVEIDSLDNDPEMGCFASNEYLSNFINLSEGRTANIISSLKKRGFLTQCFWDGRNRGLRVKLCESSLHENVKADPTETLKQPSRKREHSNTVINTDSNIYTEKFNFKKSLIDLGVSEQVASDWLKVRAKKRAANTQTAFNRIKSEIDKSRLNPNECISIAVERSWQGFNHEWVNNRNKNTLPFKQDLSNMDYTQDPRKI